MTIDYNHPDEIVLGKNLLPGDCVRSSSWSEGKDGNDMGIIVATSFHDTPEGKQLNKWYEKEPAYSIYDINCPSDGPMTSRLDPEQEFKVIRSRKDILYTYSTIDYQLLKRSSDLLRQSHELDDIKRPAMDHMNDRCDKIQKVLKYDRSKNPDICENSCASVDSVTCGAFDNIHSCPVGYAIKYTKENCPELKKDNKPFNKGIEII